MPGTIIGLRFNPRGVEVTDAEIQATWAAHVAAERAILNLDQPGRRCAHGINLERAGCGRCLVTICGKCEREWFTDTGRQVCPACGNDGDIETHVIRESEGALL